MARLAHSAASVGKMMRDQPIRGPPALASRMVVSRKNRVHFRFECAERTEVVLGDYR